MKKLLRTDLPSALALIVLTTFLTYGVLIPTLGFYRDDWYLLWVGQSQGASGIIELFKGDRPFIGYLYALDYSLLGDHPLGWHIYALLIKAASALSFFWLLRLLWPQKRLESLFLALLFVVYPGFLQQPNAGVFKNLLLAHFAATLSLGLTIHALRVRKRLASFGLHALALLLELAYLEIFESMIGLEFARVLLVGYVLYRQNRKIRPALLETFKRLSPYLLLAAAFLFWRLFLFESTRPAVDVNRLVEGYAASPWRSLLTLTVASVKDVIETTVFAWFVPAYQLTVSADARDALFAALAASLTLGLGYAYLRLSDRAGWAAPDGSPADALDAPSVMMWLGAPIVVVGLIPITLAGRDVQFSLQWDRYTLHVAMGVCLFVGGFIFHSLRSAPRWIVLFSLLALGVVTHYHSAARYRDFWVDQRSLWWQLAWRAPALEKNTMLIAQIPGHSALAEDYEVYSPADMIYYPDAGLSLAGDVLNAITIPRILREEVKGANNRGVYVRKNYRHTLIAAVPAPFSCLRVVNGRQVELPGYVNAQLLTVAAHSDIGRVLADARPAAPPAPIFGDEPPRGWCYYYQKMDLARQAGDWNQAAALGEAALELGFRPRDPSEWMPLFEAYANTGALEQAAALASEIRRDEGTWTLLCAQLGSRSDFPNGYNVIFILQTLCAPE